MRFRSEKCRENGIIVCRIYPYSRWMIWRRRLLNYLIFGVTAEMIKYSSDKMKIEILKNFNLVVHSGVFPENRHHTIFQMLPKEGDVTQVKNWWPIAILPIMYKLFARLLYTEYHLLYFLGNVRSNMLSHPTRELRMHYFKQKLLLNLVLSLMYRFGYWVCIYGKLSTWFHTSICWLHWDIMV